MFVFKSYPSIKQAAKEWISWFKSDSQFRRTFLLVFFTVMILFRTLLNRNMWSNAVSNVIGVWGLYNANGELTTEPIENIILMISFTSLLLWTFSAKLLKQVTLGNAVWAGMKYSFLFSVTIETLQLFLRLGTFQLSDIVYNTLGGTTGDLSITYVPS